MPPMRHRSQRAFNLSSLLEVIKSFFLYLHAADIKPGNIFLMNETTAKIGDLGLSRYFSSKTLQVPTHTRAQMFAKTRSLALAMLSLPASSFTWLSSRPSFPQAQSMVGTPCYMSPECIRGLPYEFSSDVWSLGCLLYEMSTLQNPFYGDSLNYYTLGKSIAFRDYLYIMLTKEMAVRRHGCKGLK